MRGFLSAIVVLLALAQPVLAEEVIRRFISDVTVNADGSLDVRERIVVVAEGNQIRRGILRDFPTQYKDRNGNRVQVGFDVMAVERDGQPENFTVSGISNGQRIQIGNADVFLQPGLHSYLIIYRTTRQLGFFADYDELYWNATGNGWTFPIEQAEVIIRLPQGAVIQQTRIYTGPFGARDSNARVLETGGRIFRAETTRPLGTGEGLTVAVAWQKGIVAPPSESQKQVWWLRDNLGFFLAGLTLAGVLGYFAYAWNRVGRDPPKGTIIPLFHPPENLGPAGVRYVWKQGYDDQAFAAAMVGLAVKGRLRISDDDGDYAIERLADKGPPLSRSEQVLFRALPGSKLELKQVNHATIGGARSKVEDALDEEYNGIMFLRNFGWYLTGAAISVVGLLVSGFFTPSGEGAAVWFIALFGSLWWGVVLAVGYAMVKGLFTGRGFLAKIRNLIGVAFLLPFVGAGVGVPTLALAVFDVTPAIGWFIAVAVTLGLSNFLFFWLLKAPTVTGRKILDEIEGFRMYMTTAEEERLKILHPPEKTPELFQRYLPYAMALDCENEWNAAFAGVLAAAAAAGAATAPIWYHGSNWNSGGFSSDLNSGLTSSISSSASAPGSSSGSGGGGSSGGGGGGGGGSGW